MKRLPAQSPQIASFILFIALCVSLAYWGMHLMKPRPRAVAAALAPAAQPVDVASAGMLFGGAPVATAMAGASNYQLKGIVASGSGRGSAAIIGIEGQPALTLGLGGAVAPGVTVHEVHPTFVVLMENGVPRRLDLPEPAAAPGMNMGMAAPVTTGVAPPGAAPGAMQPEAMEQPGGLPPGGAVPGPAPAAMPVPQSTAVPPSEPVPRPAMPSQPQAQPGQAPPGYTLTPSTTLPGPAGQPPTR